MASTRVTTYSADEVVLSLAGLAINSGYADGEFVSVEPEADDFTDKVGADGEVVRMKNLDRRATVKIKLLQTSEGNDLLSQLRATGLVGVNGADIGSFLLTDLSGAMKVRADKGWIMKPPNVSRGREVAEYEWTIRLAHTEMDILGNPAV